MKKASDWINKLDLRKHPEGGWYRELFRSGKNIPSSVLPEYKAERCFYTSIYYLLEENDFSSFHCLRSDEIWYHHCGGSVEIYTLNKKSGLQKFLLGGNKKEAQLQVLIPAGCWFAAQVVPCGEYALTGCLVSPGFEFEDFLMEKAETLLKVFPGQEKIIRRFCRD